MIIPNTVTSIGSRSFGDCGSLTDVYCYAGAVPTNRFSDAFDGSSISNCTLHVPTASIDVYKTTAPWSGFKEIVGIFPETISFVSTNIKTFSSNYSLDFTEMSRLKAYIASGFNPSTGELLLTRVYHVPAGEGLLLKGEAGEYEIPFAETNMYYSNLLKGVTTATTISPTDGDYTNFILANGTKYGIGFYTLSDAGEIAAGKAYLQLPASAVPVAEARGVKLVFDDETTGIESIDSPSADGRYFDLQGRQVKNPAKGLYIVGGRKVMVK
ncbi:MAG: hypothetical protein IJ637_07220 [Prevotella sp.]|nr:hypothetical protein [Prevotella sp.]